MKFTPTVFPISLTLFLILGCQGAPEQPPAPASKDYQDLVALFREWRGFEKPPLREGAPDYTAAAFEKRRPAFQALQARLLAMDTTGWTTPRQVDWHIAWSEMNGYDFNQRVLQPWTRDPAYYKSLWTARGLGSLYAHANEMTMEEAGGIHTEYTPRDWMKTEKDLRIFEQHLYLRQPGYGTSYITGKYLLENALADFARLKEARGEPFRMKDFPDQLNAIGNIPVSLGHWQMTGVDESIRKIAGAFAAE